MIKSWRRTSPPCLVVRHAPDLQIGWPVAEVSAVPAAVSLLNRPRRPKLLDEEVHACVRAPVPEIADPLELKRSYRAAALTPDDDPIESSDVQRRKRAEERLA